MTDTAPLCGCTTLQELCEERPMDAYRNFGLGRVAGYYLAGDASETFVLNLPPAVKNELFCLHIYEGEELIDRHTLHAPALAVARAIARERFAAPGRTVRLLYMELI